MRTPHKMRRLTMCLGAHLKNLDFVTQTPAEIMRLQNCADP